jgi:hypothetical protein
MQEFDVLVTIKVKVLADSGETAKALAMNRTSLTIAALQGKPEIGQQYNFTGLLAAR